MRTRRFAFLSTTVVGTMLLATACQLSIRGTAEEEEGTAAPTPTATPVPDAVAASYQLRNTRVGIELTVNNDKPGTVYGVLYDADPGALTAAQVKAAATGPTGGPIAQTGVLPVPVAGSNTVFTLTGVAEKKVYWLYVVSESADGLDNDADVRKYSRVLPKAMTEFTFAKVTGPSSGTTVYYAASVPQDYYNNPSADYPILIWYPGNGENFTDPANAESNYTSLAGLMGPMKRLNNDLYDIPMIVIAPMCNYSYFNCGNGQEITLYKEAYDDALTRFRVNTKRVYVAGISYGGEGVFRFANAYPTLVAAAVPIATSSPIATGILCGNLGPNNVAVWGLVNRGDSFYGSVNLSQNIADLRGCASYTDPRARARITVFNTPQFPNTIENHGSAENLALELPLWWGGQWQYWNGSAQVADTDPPTHPNALHSTLLSATPGNTMDAPIIAMDSFATASADLGAPINTIYDWMLQYSKP